MANGSWNLHYDNQPTYKRPRIDQRSAKHIALTTRSISVQLRVYFSNVTGRRGNYTNLMLTAYRISSALVWMPSCLMISYL
jgi:hypothetical protein